MVKTDQRRVAQNGRSKVRRLNRFEYENTLRHVLDAPWLQVAERLPEDGTAYLYNKIGNRLDVSHVQMAKYLEVAEYAIRSAIGSAAFPSTKTKYYAREEPTIQNYLRTAIPTRASTPLLGLEPQLEVIRGHEPVTVGESNPEKRELEAFGVVLGTYTATTKYDFTRLNTPTDGRYRIRMKTYTFRAGPNGRRGGSDHGLSGGTPAWWRPDRTVALPGFSSEPITIYALSNSGDSRWLTTFDSFPEPHVIEREVVLRTGENIRPDAGRLIRTRPGWKGNPNATPEGVPGFALNWLEVEGPLHEQWPPSSDQAVFDNLSFEINDDNKVSVLSDDAEADAQRLLLNFLRKAYRRPLSSKDEIAPSMAIYRRAIELDESFTDAIMNSSPRKALPSIAFGFPKIRHVADS